MKPSITASISGRFYLPAIILLSFCACGLVLFSTALYGAGLSPDSVGYISAARAIIAGSGVNWFDGSPFVGQPPLYPALLALAGVISGKDPLALAHFINAIIFGLIIFLSGRLFFRHLREDPRLPLFGVMILLFLPVLSGMAVMAFSEPLFIIFTLFFFIFLERFILLKDRTSFLIFTLSAALACLTRYIGITLIISGMLVILLMLKTDLKSKIRYSLIFLVLSALPTGTWILRNYLISGILTGERAQSLYSLKQNIFFTLIAILNGYFPGAIIKYPAVIIFIIVLISAVILLLLISFKKPRKFTALFQQTGIIFIFVVIYSSFLIFSSTTTAYDKIDNRLLSPVYIPLTLLILIFSEKIIRLLRNRKSRIFIAACAGTIICAWFIVYPLRVTLKDAANRKNMGAGGYHTREWKESILINYLKNNSFPGDRLIYCNAPDALYILTGINSSTIPFKTAYNSNKQVNNLQELKDNWLKNDSAYIIWFNKTDRKFLFSIDELRTIAAVRLSACFSDGKIYKASPAP